LELVRDPWLPFVYFGIFLLITGTTMIIWFGKNDIFMWIHFELFALISIFTWSIAACLYLFRKRLILTIAEILTLVGIASLLYFTISLWISLDRPPLRTLGETRLWYSLFLSIIGYAIYKRWQYRIFFVYALAMAILFLSINYARPDIHSKDLMPALQSVWFVPHVIVYIVGYAFLGFATIMGIAGLLHLRKKQETAKILTVAQNLVYIGYGFVTLGLLFGALWAKEAWGHYWTWDPKETWALLTWGVYLIWMHMGIKKIYTHQFYFLFLCIAFIVLILAWFGVNYLPAAQSSVHVYS
jgi:ABC-type transport system involved in cytochrome c biogenesis permease subunit